MTERQPERTDTTRTEYRPTLGEMSHTNPYTGEAFGATQTYGRGRFVAADGGRDPGDDAGADADSDEAADGETLQDVDHDPPGDGDGAAPVYRRGNEGREDVRVPDEDGR
jgi:hypothetical protein